MAAATLSTIGLTSSSSSATTTVTPSEPGATPTAPVVVRDSNVSITSDNVGLSYFRLFAFGNYSALSPQFVAAGLGCRGDDPAGTNSSARGVVTVTDPSGDVVLTATSPVRAVSLLSSSAPPANPQPGPNATNYRGGFTGDTSFTTPLDLSGKEAGVYTVKSVATNTLKTGNGACSVGRQTSSGVVLGTVTESSTFEYRPWQATFRDVFGGGKVNANVTPREFQFSIGSKRSPVYAGTTETQQFYSLDGQFLLPSDPAACAALPSSCLPAAAAQCEPSTGCVPRLMIINRHHSASDPYGLVGVFDLETKAFIALAEVEGSSRVLTSLGIVNDAHYKATLQQLSDAAAAQGIDLATLLASEVIVRDETKQMSVSLLNGLQFDPSSTRGGVHLSSASTVQAGVILDIYSSLSLSGNSCVANSASSSSEVDRFTRTASDGYTVTKTDLLPKVPSVGPLGAIVGGPVYHIQGKFNDGALLNAASAVIGVDTATDEPNGYPVWISPFLSGGIHVAKPKTMDFVGTATWSASEAPLGANGCLVIDFMLGTGVAVFNNPLPVGLGTLIDMTGTPNPDAAKLTAAVDTALSDAVASVTSVPVIDQVLGTVLEALPPIS